MENGPPPVHARARDPLPDDVGQRLRAVRAERGIGLRELSRRLGVSPSALSQIETGRTRPTVMTLYSIVRELEMSLDELLHVPRARMQTGPPVTQEGAVVPLVPGVVAPAGVEEAVRFAPGVASAGEEETVRFAPGVVLHADDRGTIEFDTGVRWQRLTPLPEPNADFLFVTYDVGASSSREPIAVRDAGREYGLVLSGRIRIALGSEEHELGSQDSIAFDASMPHRIDNVGDEPATVIWCLVGPVP